MKLTGLRKLAFAVFSVVCLQLFAATPAIGAEPPDTDEVHVLQIDINGADAQTLAAVLEGVGLAKAEEIVAHRNLYGAFRSVDELLEVKGIGTATLEKNRARIKVVSQ